MPRRYDCVYVRNEPDQGARQGEARSETTENSASDLKQKRTSFRVKAENFTKTSEKKNSKVKKLKKMSKSKVKDEALINSVKREGWWSQ